MRIANKCVRHARTSFVVLFLSILSLCIIVACSGYGSNYTIEDEYSDLFDESSSSYDRYVSCSSNERYSSSYKNSSSSSSGSSSSSSLSRSSSSQSGTNSSSYDKDSADSIPKVKTVADIDSCEEGSRYYVLSDSNVYRCTYGLWIKEIRSDLDCSKKNEGDMYYNRFPYVCKSEKWYNLTTLEAKLGICNVANQGKYVVEGTQSYKCDSLAWIKQGLTDVYGKCDNAKLGDSITFQDVNYICRDGEWNRFTKTEQDSGLCTKARFGELLVSTTSSGTKSYLVCRDYEWVSTTAAKDIYGACDNTKIDSVYEVNSYQYVCEDAQWRSLTTFEKKYGICTAKIQDSLATASSTSHLICDKHKWRTATAEEFMGACTKALLDTLYYYNDTTVYTCTDNLKWVNLPKPPSSLGYCTGKTEGKKYKQTSPKKYWVCSNYAWTEVDSLTYEFGACTEALLGVKKSLDPTKLSYECRLKSNGSYAWVQMTFDEEYGNTPCTDEIQDKVVMDHICNNGKWRDITNLEKKLGKTCTKTNIGERAKNNGYYYACKDIGWTSISAAIYDLGVCNEENANAVGVYNKVEYLCQDGSWSIPDKLTSIQTCSYSDRGKIGSYDGHIYKCLNDGGRGAWEWIGNVGVKYGLCTNENALKIVTYNDTLYICYGNRWKQASLKQILDASTCGEKDVYGQKYTCSGGDWTPVYGTMTDSRDGQSYKILKIHEKTWMAENLRYKTTNSWCFQNIENNCKDGRLYTWENVKNVCPTGWHAADLYDYADLYLDALDISFVSEDGWQDPPYGVGNHYPGLEITGIGARFPNGSFELDHRFAGVWLNGEPEEKPDSAAFLGFGNTINQKVTENVGLIPISKNRDGNPYPGTLHVTIQSKEFGFFIRCVKDN